MRRVLLPTLLLLLLMGCAQKPVASVSEPIRTETPAPTATLVPTPTATPFFLELGGQQFTGKEQELSAILTAEELPALDSFSRLVQVDLTGSDCYEAIEAYAMSHPDVKVVYTVQVEAEAVPHEAESLSLASLHNPAPLTHLPQLKALAVSEPLSPATAAALRKALPEVELSFQLQLGEQTLDAHAMELDLTTGESLPFDDVLCAVVALPDLGLVRLGEGYTLPQVGQIQSLRPELPVDYTTTAFGVTFSLTDELVSFSKIDLSSRVEELRSLLPYLGHVGRLDMEYCNIPDEQMGALRAEFPSPKIVWRIFMRQYSCRTDAIMIRFSDDSDNRRLYDKDVKPLIYCNEIRYMDLGHDRITDAYFTAYMPDLEVCILAVGEITDISAFANCPKLEYLEIFTGHITDISALAHCKNLKHLNISRNEISDISPLFGLNLERLWLSRNPIPQEQIEEFRRRFPGCELNTDGYNPTGDNWRGRAGYVPRYKLLRQQLCYDDLGINTYCAFNIPYSTSK